MYIDEKSYFIEFRLIMLAVFTGCINFGSNSREHKLLNEGNKMIQKIEIYKKEKGKIPNTLNEIGINETEQGPIYYQKIDSASYMIWFGTTLGESKTYYSNEKNGKTIILNNQN